MDMEEMKKDFRDMFLEMRMLGWEVHKAIIESCLNSEAYANYDLDGMIYWNRYANPLDFLSFRSWMLTYEKKDDKEIRKIYEEIANKVLAAHGSLDVCFNELLRCCKPYVINLAKEGCYYHNRYVFKDYIDNDVIDIFKDSEDIKQDETSIFSNDFFSVSNAITFSYLLASLAFFKKILCKK